MGIRLEIDIPEHHYNNIMAFDSVSLGRVPYKGIIMYAINAIKHGKVLDQEPRKGHWIRELIRNEKGGCIGAKMICSECDNDNKHDEYMNYCPNCGCRMIESQESEA